VSAWVYIQAEPCLWTVGVYDGDGKFRPESDHGSPDEAAERVRHLNGGTPAEPAPERDYLHDILTVLESIDHNLFDILNAIQAGGGQ
jgi:hypothetical protein